MWIYQIDCLHFFLLSVTYGVRTTHSSQIGNSFLLANFVFCKLLYLPLYLGTCMFQFLYNNVFF